jgi:3-hydroxyacyl-CoA dehydrogenase/enoyl-CoA hydratase/3-hydroxybutyryl-CoA epimerase
MGGGIARAAAGRGMCVRVHDRRPEALGRLIAAAAGGGRRGDRLDWRLTTTLGPHGFRRCELVIEAVSEDLDTKHAVLREIEGEVREVAVLASNTSTLPIAQIARGLRYPNRVLGLHFFSPVERMPLVEVVRHPTAGDPFVARARSFVRSLGKTPVVVRDGPGFFTTRVLAPYLAQGARLVAEGAAIADVDAAARAFGFPVGPLELLDEVGLDVAAAAGATLHGAFADRMSAPRHFRQMVENGRLGRKVGRGFYDYRDARGARRRRKRPDTVVEDLLRSDEPHRAPTREAMSERLAWALIGEAWRALADGIVATEADGDLAAVLGIGFPGWRGGPFRFVRSLPAGDASTRLRRLTDVHGAPFDGLDGVLPRD